MIILQKKKDDANSMMEFGLFYDICGDLKLRIMRQNQSNATIAKMIIVRAYLICEVQTVMFLSFNSLGPGVLPVDNFCADLLHGSQQPSTALIKEHVLHRTEIS